MPKPKPAIPNPAAVLPGEADILAAVIADLSDDTAKLVYADWLQDRDDPRGPLLRNFVTAFRAGKKLPPVKSAPQPWRDLVGITLMAKVRGTVLEAKADQLLALAKPALTFKPVKASEKSLAVGASKFGGQPDLPLKTKWPAWQKEPLAFLAQFNLADLRPSPVCRELPATGVLSVFYAGSDKAYDNSDKGGWRVFHFPDVSALTRRELPEELDEDHRFKSCQLSFTEIVTLPDPDSPWEKELTFGDDATTEAYAQLHSASGLGNRLLGYPDPLQNDMLGKKTVRHLVTIDSDDAPGWMWGDCGLLYFTVREDHLQRHKFEQVRFDFQCC